MHGDNVRRVRYLGVQRGQRLANAVIVYNQVVNAQNTRTLQHGIGNRLGDFRVGCLTDQRAERIARNADTRPDDEQRHQYTDHAVDRQGGELTCNHADKHNAGGDHVVDAYQPCG